MSQLWTILDKISGAVICPCFETPSFGSHPKDNGWAWDAETQSATRIDRIIDPAAEHRTTSGWAINAAAVDAMLHARIDEQAGEFRKRFLTVVPGQEMTYLRKEQEARAWHDGMDPASAPFIAAEASATGRTMEQVATMVIAQASAWAQLGAAIEGMRMGAKAAVSAAATREEKVVAAAVNWEAILS